MNSTQEYSLWEYVHKKQVWIDFLMLLVVNYIAFSCYADSLRGGFEDKDFVTQSLIKHGGNLNEGFMWAMICHICLVGLSYAGEKDLKNGIMRDVKNSISIIFDSKEKIRSSSAIIGWVLVSVAELFWIWNTADIKDIPAGLFGALWFHIITTKNPYKISPKDKKMKKVIKRK